MIQFFQENYDAFIGIIVMAVYWFALNFHSVKGNIKDIDKKRAEKGLPQMTEEEKQIIRSTLRSSVTNDSLGALVGGIVAIVVTHLIVIGFI